MWVGSKGIKNMSVLFEVPENNVGAAEQQAALVEQSRARTIMDRAKQLVGRGALVATMAVAGGAVAGGEIVLEDASPAYAASFTNDYPDSDAADCSTQFGIYSWCKDEDGSGHYEKYEDISPRGYGYRNCTDGVAYWVKKYTDVTLPSGTVLRDAMYWDDNMPSAYTVYAGNTNNIEPGDIAQSDDGSFGHVEFVTEVTKDANGTVTSFRTASLNKGGSGEYTPPDAAASNYTTRNSAGNFSRGGTNDWDHFIDVNGLGKGLNNEDLTGGGGAGPSRPAALQYGSEMDVFIRGGDGQIYKNTYNPSTVSWSGFGSMGGNMASDPAAVQYGSEMVVVARGSDNKIKKNTWNPSANTWSGWVDMGTNTFTGKPAIIQHGSELDVLAKASDGQVYKNTWNPSNNTWSGWNTLGGNIKSNPTVMNYGSTEMDVYAVASDDQVTKDTWNGTNWGGFVAMSGCLTADPAPLQYGSEMHIWARGCDGKLWKRTWNGSSWGGWDDFGGAIQGGPSALQYGSEMDVFVRDTGGQIQKRTWNGSTWSNFVGMGGVVASEPTAIQYGSEMVVFASKSDGHVVKNTWNPTASTWSGWVDMG
jgi:hypothetical protein